MVNLNLRDPQTRRFAQLALVVLLILAAILYVANKIASPRPSIGGFTSEVATASVNASVQPAPNSAAQPVTVVDGQFPQPAASAESLAGNAAIGFILSDGLYEGQREQLKQDVHDAFAYVGRRIGLAEPRQRYTVAFTYSADCSLSGMARSDGFVAQVFTCDSIPSAQAMAIMAHEIAHLMSYERYGVFPAVGSDLMLVEGLATYAAATYWLGGSEDLRGYVRDQRAASVTPELLESYRGVDTDAMNASYYQWASFVDFLKQRCTAEGGFDALYATGSGEIGSASYLRHCGQSVNDLQLDWLAWLAG